MEDHKLKQVNLMQQGEKLVVSQEIKELIQHFYKGNMLTYNMCTWIYLDEARGGEGGGGREGEDGGRGEEEEQVEEYFYMDQ